ncbi:MAG: LamG-like jellyroll fold domain-containing protein [Crocinitomicaceae bacterium]
MNIKLLWVAFASLLFSQTIFSQLAGSGKAFDFASTYINVPNSTSLNPSTSITLEAWIKADTYAGNSWENVIISKDGWGTGNQGYTLRTGAGGILSFNFSSAGVWKEVTTSAVMTIGNWYHVAASYDGTTLRIYVNGVELNTLAFSGPITNGAYDVTIGKMAYLAGGTRYFDGQIDEVKIWSTALTNTQIKDYMCKKVTSSHPSFASLAGYWNLDQSGVLTDQSMNGNDAVNVGATQINSGAPIGDVSVYSYLSPVNLSLSYPMTDTAVVSSSSILPLVHLYRVDATPLVTTAAPVVDSIDQTHYYGVYTTPTPASSYQFVYKYGANPLLIGNENYGQVSARATGSTTPWAPVVSAQNQSLNTFTYAATGRKEYILSIACPLLTISPSTTQNVCEGDTVHFSITGNPTNVQWFEGSTALVGETAATLNVTTSGVYYITGNAGICADAGNSVTVNVHPIPTVYFGDLDTVFCKTEGLQTITNKIPAVGGTYSGPGIFGSTFTPNMTSVGTHTLYFNYTDGFGCHNSDSVVVTIGDVPPAPVITQSAGFVLCTPACGTFTWALDGVVIPGETGNCYTATANGNYTVFCTTPEGCESTIASYAVAGVGIEELSWGNLIEISPNPTNGALKISLPIVANENLPYEVMTANGQIVSSAHFSGLQAELNLQNLSEGVYFIVITGNEGTIVRRIVKN